jgi:hypothetical protein
MYTGSGEGSDVIYTKELPLAKNMNIWFEK